MFAGSGAHGGRVGEEGQTALLLELGVNGGGVLGAYYVEAFFITFVRFLCSLLSDIIVEAIMDFSALLFGYFGFFCPIELVLWFGHVSGDN